MPISTYLSGEQTVMKVVGNLDSELLGDELLRVFNEFVSRGSRNLAVDLSEAEVINTYGVGKILQCHLRLRAEGSGLVVKNNLAGFVRDVFEALMLDRALVEGFNPDARSQACAPVTANGVPDPLL